MKMVCNYAAKEKALKIEEKSDSLGPVCPLLGDLAQDTPAGMRRLARTSPGYNKDSL
jgi:hypothetical protein